MIDCNYCIHEPVCSYKGDAKTVNNLADSISTPATTNSPLHFQSTCDMYEPYMKSKGGQTNVRTDSANV